MRVLGCVCLCTLGREPSIVLAPSGLCVGLFHQRRHLLVFYSGPQGLQWLHNLPDLLIKPIRLAPFAPKIWLLFPICAGFPRRSSAESRWCAHEASPINDSRAATFQEAATRGWIWLFSPSVALGGNWMFKGWIYEVTLCCPVLHMCENHKKEICFSSFELHYWASDSLDSLK